MHDFQEAGVLPGLNNLAFDITGVLDPTSWYGAAISGMFNITAAPTRAGDRSPTLAYLVPVLRALPAGPRAARPPRPDRCPTAAAAGTTPNPETSQHVAA